MRLDVLNAMHQTSALYRVPFLKNQEEEEKTPFLLQLFSSSFPKKWKCGGKNVSVALSASRRFLKLLQSNPSIFVIVFTIRGNCLNSRLGKGKNKTDRVS